MTPGARAAAAIEILDQWLAGQARADALLRQWGRANRYAGSGDRRAIGNIVYDCLRQKSAFAAASGADGGRGIVHGWALAADLADDLFNGQGHAPPPLLASEKSEPGALSDPARLCYPSWLDPLLRAALGEDFERSMLTMSERAPIDLRINHLKADVDMAFNSLRADGLDPTTVPDVPDALRCVPGARVANAKAYLLGWVEIQDAASQMATAACTPAPGSDILDFCAGGGGKSLALASYTRGQCQIVAHDIDTGRTRDLPTRADRAGAKIEVLTTEQLDAGGRTFDLVFVDAPCSGSGTWRRDPEAKWALTPDILSRRIADQQAAFQSALTYLRPGGMIVYATCSFLIDENQKQIETFMSTNPDLALKSMQLLKPGQVSDGFFSAQLIRNRP